MSAAAQVLSLLEAVVGGPLPVRIRCWDGSEAGDPAAPAAVVFRRRRALRRLLWAPNELGLARAYVSGDVDIDGDIFALLDVKAVIDRLAEHQAMGLHGRQWLDAAVTGMKLGALGLPPKPPVEEIRLGRAPRHSKRRDARAVSHHYDVGNDFYRLVLGPTMVYSCAYWAQPPGPAYTVDNAQRDKCELVCAKLRLRPGMRLLDVGCGWGTLLVHAARHHGITGVGVTLSRQQVAGARARIAEAGLSERLEIRQQDYRDVHDGPYDAIVSVGMAEHVGKARLGDYCATLYGLLRPEGRLLNHAIASVRALPDLPTRATFIERYVFPDGELVTLGTMLAAMERVGLEVRDVEALREHYGLTLRAWVANLERSWQQAQRLAAPGRVRVWLLYMAAAALAFEHGGLTVHQVLAVKQGDRGASGMPLTREEWLGPTAPGGAG